MGQGGSASARRRRRRTKLATKVVEILPAPSQACTFAISPTAEKSIFAVAEQTLAGAVRTRDSDSAVWVLEYMAVSGVLQQLEAVRSGRLLHQAAATGMTDVVRVLLAQNADPLLATGSEHGYTPPRSCVMGAIDAVMRLLSHVDMPGFLPIYDARTDTLAQLLAAASRRCDENETATRRLRLEAQLLLGLLDEISMALLCRMREHLADVHGGRQAMRTISQDFQNMYGLLQAHLT